MEWLLFTYWLPPQPSRKRVALWRQLKKVGALSQEGGGWIVPNTETLSAKMKDIQHTVEEMGGTANLYAVSHIDDSQEQRTRARFGQEREREYAEMAKECQKTLSHIQREEQAHQFNLEEVEELEADLGKISRWFAEARERDFWEVAAREEVQSLIGQGEERLAAFVERTYEELRNSEKNGL